MRTHTSWSRSPCLRAFPRLFGLVALRTSQVDHAIIGSMSVIAAAPYAGGGGGAGAAAAAGAAFAILLIVPRPRC